MTKLLDVTEEHEQSLFGGSPLRFDGIVPFREAVDFMANVYGNELRARGISSEVHVDNLRYDNGNPPGVRSLGIYVEGANWIGGDFEIPLFWVTATDKDRETYRLMKFADPENLESNKHPLIEVDRVKMFAPYLGMDTQEILHGNN